MSNCVTHHACDCIMDKVIKYEKLQKELESVRAENYRIRCEKQSDLNKIAESEFNENQANDRLKEARAELTAEKAKANELLEALESIYNIDAKRLDQFHTPIDSLNDVYEVAEQAIAKYRQAEGQR